MAIRLLDEKSVPWHEGKNNRRVARHLHKLNTRCVRLDTTHDEFDPVLDFKIFVFPYTWDTFLIQTKEVFYFSQTEA